MMHKSVQAITSFCLFSLSISMSSCSESEPAMSMNHGETTEQSNPTSSYRTIDDAISIAENATKWFDETEVSSRQEVRTANISEIKVISSPVLSRNNGASTDTLMYVVNYNDNAGFAIISAKKSAPELIAVTQSGSYDPTQPSDNPVFESYIENAKTLIAQSNVAVLDTNLTIKPGIGGGLQPAIKEKTVIDTVWYNNIPVRAKVHWSQTEQPENQYCPNQVTGCAPLAIAMGMVGLQYPDSITLTHLATRPKVWLNWAEIAQHMQFRRGEANCSLESYGIHETIGRLCYEIGFLGHADYTTYIDKTGMDKYQVMTSMRLLNFSYEDVASPEQYAVSSKLSNNSVLIMYGNNKSGFGHMWLCDGVKHYRTIENYYRSYDGGKTWKHEGGPDYYPEVAYNFYNWGMKASYCGYYLDLTYFIYDKAYYGYVKGPSTAVDVYNYNPGFIVMSKR